MGNLFGRKKQSRVTEQDKAVLQLKQQRDKLKQYQKRVAQQLEREREIARQLLRDGRKERAKLLLKKKRYQEQLLDKTENQITSLETMVQNIEFAQIEMKVVEGLQIGNECLKKMHQVMSLEEVERILEETQEAVEYQRQIDELLSGSFTQEDEDTILEELNAITQVRGPPALSTVSQVTEHPRTEHDHPGERSPGTERSHSGDRTPRTEHDHSGDRTPRTEHDHSGDRTRRRSLPRVIIGLGEAPLLGFTGAHNPGFASGVPS
uniref:Charged multivesicular body protein 6 n=1 Tax=Felis catus TaxID=9685 RepID=A0ABI7ZRU1_FELCA